MLPLLPPPAAPSLPLYLQLVLNDRTPTVRRELVEIVATWVKTIPPHAQQEMSPRLLPFVLAGISDESPEVQARSLDLMDGIGEYVLGSTRPSLHVPVSIFQNEIFIYRRHLRRLRLPLSHTPLPTPLFLPGMSRSVWLWPRRWPRAWGVVGGAPPLTPLM